jgi:transcriptional regulator with XRE-family HTH domain
MSYLSIALQRQTERHHLKQADLARGSGLSPSYVSRLVGGEAHELSDENFVALSKIFSADPLAQAELVAGRCQDVRVGPGADLVEVRIKAPGQGVPAGTESEEKIHLSPETERAFAFLRSQCPLSSELEKHLVGYARLLGMK